MDHLDAQILKRAAAGDMAAFEALYKAYAPFVYNVALRMVEAKEDAEEVTQEVFLIVHKKLGSFMFRSTLKTWVYRITTNCAINLLNKRNKDQKGRVDFEDAAPFLQSSDDPRQGLVRSDQAFQVRRLLNILNPDERACIVLREIEGLSYEEIAQSVGANINTVRTRLKRAREKMLQTGKEAVTDEL